MDPKQSGYLVQPSGTVQQPAGNVINQPTVEMYPKQSGYLFQPSGTVQQPAGIVANQPPAVLPPAQSEERAKITKATIIMAVSFVIAMVCGVISFFLIINAFVQISFDNSENALPIIFFSIGGGSGFIAICFVVVGIIYILRVRKLEAEWRQTQRELTQLPGPEQYNAVFSNSNMNFS